MPGINNLQQLQQINEQELYGGAILMNVPPSFEYLREVLPVPDHQEIFSEPQLQQTIIFEINQKQDIQDSDAARFMFDDYADAAESQETRLDNIQNLQIPPHLPVDCGVAFMVKGKMKIVKGRPTNPPMDVAVVMGLLRLPRVQSDILLIVHVPTGNYVGNNQEELAKFQAQQLFISAFDSLKIVDWGVFGT
eukprot:TRINITY_DN6821_c0_g3_i2.p2 TRINITY_DN6821_c0_g3~~TRINITY_DN6821_c0_g3_i2.p2  ORF type:complete len:192 (-),score=26.27 TRINITY_DN6821_c0_g3_i2:215-790(-)